MNNFTSVLLAVKEYCHGIEIYQGEDCLAIIAKNAKIRSEELPDYLATLHMIGVLKYYPQKRSVELTSLGWQTEELFI